MLKAQLCCPGLRKRNRRKKIMRSLKEKRQREGKRDEKEIRIIRWSRIKTRNTEKNERFIRKRKGGRKRGKRGGWKERRKNIYESKLHCQFFKSPPYV
jgi:hypothetical protein